MIIDDDSYLAHYGILRRSGRYPWGSGGNVETRSRSFLQMVKELRDKGMSDLEIARGMALYTENGKPWTSTEFRAANSIARNAAKQADIAMAQRYKARGWSNVEIAKRMGINESSVRALLAPGAKDKADILVATANQLKQAVEEKKYVQVGVGVERHMGVSQSKLSTAVARLEQEGYKVHYLQVPQVGTGLKTTVKVLTKDDVSYSELYKNRDKVDLPVSYSEDGGRSYIKIQRPISVSSKRVQVVYGDEGGRDADGVIYVRPGVKDLSLGGNRYAQVRIMVDGTHFLKGMAVYKDDLPPGVDLQFNTNKKNTGNKHDAMKPLESDPDNPFGATIRRQITHEQKDGTHKVTSAMNIINEEATWDKWSRTLSSQMLSKQKPDLASAQLRMTQERKRDELDRILSLTNPTVRKKLLEEFADGADSSAVHLKAAALPRQSNHVILPVPSLKEGEIYAPTFRDGERVVLIRHPHGGIFEIPELTVNNRHPPAKKLLGNATAAVGIHPKVAERLSGADFDGDTVIVIPNNKGRVKTKPALEGLKGFDPKASFPGYPGMKEMTSRQTQVEMGKISNLITDMTIHGASDSELARAVRHSMVVIDAEKHGLDFRASEKANGIANLREKYQAKPGGGSGGAATLISRAGSEKRILERKPRPAAEGGPIDKATGRKVFVETGATRTTKTGAVVPKTVKTTKLADERDAHKLSSGTRIEKIYADHSNALKSMADEARLAAVHTKGTPYSQSARSAYHTEVASLQAKLNLALKNAPLERQAQVIANAIVSQKRQENPHMDASDLKRVKKLALDEARARTGAGKHRIEVTPSEWEAIQAGAISTHQLTQILDNANMDTIKKHATPRTAILMTPTKKARAQTMLASGYTQAEVADALGVSLTTLKEGIK